MVRINVKDFLTAEEWLDLLNRDGNGLPQCCGAVSEMRERIMDIVHNGFELYPSAVRHFQDCFENLLHYHPLDEWNGSPLIRLAQQIKDAVDAPEGALQK